MTRYRRNDLVVDAIHRHPTAGLPLFAQLNRDVSKRDRRIIKEAPRAIQVATETRHLAYRTLVYDADSLAEKQWNVLHVFIARWCIFHRDATNAEVALILHWPINRVVPRTFELRQLDLLLPSEKRECDITGYFVQAWKPAEGKLFGPTIKESHGH